MRIFLLIFLITFLNTRCKEKAQSCKGEIDNLLFVSKASYCYEGLKSDITYEKKDIRKICEALNNLSKPLDDVYVNNNYGFIEVIRNNKVLFSGIFSDYNGPIIRYNGEYYKNDELFGLTMKYLDMRLKENAPLDCEKAKLILDDIK